MVIKMIRFVSNRSGTYTGDEMQSADMPTADNCACARRMPLKKHDGEEDGQ
jgi:hypothetical protein